MSTIKLSVVIVNYNTRADLHACLAALDHCVPRPEIIVVDNNSADGSAEMVAAEFPRVVLLTPGRNTWFTGGNNLGIAVAHGEYILLLNPDTIPSPGSMALLVHFMDANPGYAGATMQLRYPDGSIQRTCSQIPTYRYLLLTHTPLGMLLRGMRERAQAAHWYDGWSRETDKDVEVVPGACLLMRSDELHLDENLLLYFPEDDLSQQVGGRKFRYLTELSITHREKSSTNTPSATQIYFRDLMVYTRKHHGWLLGTLLWLLSRPLAWGLAVKWKLRRDR
ncbi:MAG: glycosyltransferase family 2 protein [Chloroflexi bacterium]|nr:glycosyltransferase family 2 protein [Chloroflexota bacterium]